MKQFCKSMFFFWMCAVLVLTNSCSSGIDLSNIGDPSIKIDESLLVPVAQVHLSVKDILDKIGIPSRLDTTSNEVTFVWAAKDSFRVKDFSFADSVKTFEKTYKVVDYIPVGIPLNPLPLPLINLNIPDSVDFGLNKDISKQTIDSLIINSTEMLVSLDVSDDLKQYLNPTDFTLQFLFNSSDVRVKDGTIPTCRPQQYGQPQIIPIGNYSLLLKRRQKIPYNIGVKIVPSKPFVFTPTSTVKLTIKFKNIDFAIAYGMFDVNISQERGIVSDFHLEDYLPVGELKFADPKIKVTAHSNLGINLDMNLDYIAAYNSTTPQNKVWAWFDNHATNLKHEYIPGPSKLGDWLTTPIPTYNKNNGEIDHFFDKRPYSNAVLFKFSLTRNPSSVNNFITPDSRINLDTKIELPFKLKGGSYYTITDTISNLNIGNTFNDIDSAILILKLNNGLPMKANYRMTFHKSDMPNDTVPAIGGMITKVNATSNAGNITSEYELISPKVDVDGNVTELVPQTLKVVLNRSQIEALKQTQFIVFRLTFDSGTSVVDGVESQNAIHITPNNTFDAKLGIFVVGTITGKMGSIN